MEATGFFPHLIFIARNLTKIVPLFSGPKEWGFFLMYYASMNILITCQIL